LVVVWLENKKSSINIKEVIMATELNKAFLGRLKEVSNQELIAKA